MEFDNCYFTNILFTNINNEDKRFNSRMEKNDRFYKRLFPYISEGKANGQKPLTVDSLSIPKSYYQELKKQTYKMTANTIFEKKQENGVIDCFAGVVTIDRVSIDNVNPQNIKPDGEQIIISLCDLVLQYQTRIEYRLINEEE
jgi:hypothetical protein